MTIAQHFNRILNDQRLCTCSREKFCVTKRACLGTIKLQKKYVRVILSKKSVNVTQSLVSSGILSYTTVALHLYCDYLVLNAHCHSTLRW